MRSRRKLPEAIYRACLFVLPLALAFLYVVSLLPIVSWNAWLVIVQQGMVLYLFAPVGTEVVIPLMMLQLRGLGAAPHEYVFLVVSIVLVDVFTALWVAWNWDLLERVPRLGGVLKRVEARCRKVIAKNRWGEGLTLAALATYVALPVQMTGGLFGSLLGRVMGMDRTRVFFAVVAGSAIGAVPMGIAGYFAAQAVLDVFHSPSVETIGAVAGILIIIASVAVVAVLYIRGKRGENRG